MSEFDSPSQQQSVTEVRRVRRSRQDRVIGGVCGGLGRYLQVDPVLLRIAAVALALSGGLGVLAYIIAWITIPEETGAEPALAHRRDNRHGLALVVGAALVALGGLLLVQQVLPWFGAAFFWPLVVVAVGVLVLISGQPVTAMSANFGSPAVTESRNESAGGVRVDRIVIGLLIGASGVAWLLDQAGVSVPWQLFPAVALMLIGSALLATLIGGRGRGALVTLGIITTVLGVAVGVGADRYAGPVGDLTLAPAVAEWPVQQHISAGTVTVDLTRHPLPEAGQLQVDVGAGRIVLVLPHESTAGVEATVTAGTVTVDGVKLDDGVDLRWTHQPNISPSVVLTLHVGLGDIEVSHE